MSAPAAPLAASIAAAASAEGDMGAPSAARRQGASVDPHVDRRRTARIAGALYLAVFVLGPFVYFYIPGELFTDDAATTAAAISENVGLFKAGMIAETLIVGIEIALAGLLWSLFRPVSRALAMASSLARFGEAMIQTVNVLVAGAVLVVVERGGLAGVTGDERDGVIGLLADIVGFGVMVWGLLFGLHLAFLGFLVRRSDLMPRWIGTLLMVASIGYLAQSYGHIVDAGLDGFFGNLVVVMSLPGEFAFAGYLVLRGVRATAPAPSADRRA